MVIVCDIVYRHYRIHMQVQSELVCLQLLVHLIVTLTITIFAMITKVMGIPDNRHLPRHPMAPKPANLLLHMYSAIHIQTMDESSSTSNCLISLKLFRYSYTFMINIESLTVWINRFLSRDNECRLSTGILAASNGSQSPEIHL